MSKHTPTLHLFRKHHFGDWLRWTHKPTCSFEDKGLLVTTIDAYWEGECTGLPADPKQLAKEIGCTAEMAQSMLATTTGHEVIESRLHWREIKQNYDDALALRAKNMAAGRASGQVRAIKQLTNVDRTVNQPQATSHKPDTKNQKPNGVSTGGDESIFQTTHRVT